MDLGQYVPTREGYTFAGWYSDEALTQKVTSVKLNGNTTVYAKWTENAVTPTLPFTDVKTGDWFYEAVQYVYDKGMMTGVSADRFAPASTTTRGMIVTVLYRLENEPAVVRLQRLHRRGERRLVCRCRCLGSGQRHCQRHQRHHLRPQQPHHPGADGDHAVPVCRLQGL